MLHLVWNVQPGLEEALRARLNIKGNTGPRTEILVAYGGISERTVSVLRNTLL